MSATIVLASSANLMMMRSTTTSHQFSTRFSILHKSVVGVLGQPLHISGIMTSCQARRDFSMYCLQPGNHLPPTGDYPGLWQLQWIFGIIATVIVPIFTRKWTNLLKIKDEVDRVVEESEQIVGYVEEAAETVDKVAKDVAEHLPEGGKWRNAAVFVETVAEEVAKDAHLVEDFLHKVEEVEERVELLVESKDQTKDAHAHAPKDII